MQVVPIIVMDLLRNDNPSTHGRNMSCLMDIKLGPDRGDYGAPSVPNMWSVQRYYSRRECCISAGGCPASE